MRRPCIWFVVSPLCLELFERSPRTEASEFQSDERRKHKLDEMKKREAKQAKYEATKTAKGKRMEDRRREDEKRQRLEQAMASAAAELYVSLPHSFCTRGQRLTSAYALLGFTADEGRDQRQGTRRMPRHSSHPSKLTAAVIADH